MKSLLIARHNALNTHARISPTSRMVLVGAYYTPEQMEQFKEAAERVGPDEMREVEETWTALLAEVRANRDLDPACAEAKALANRWDELTERTMRGFEDSPELKQAIAENYEQGRFEGFDRAPQAADFEFIARVKAAAE